MLETPLNQDIIVTALEDHPVALGKLVEAMGEFASLHEQSQQEVGEEDSQRTVVDNDETEVAENVATKIRKMLKGIRER